MKPRTATTFLCALVIALSPAAALAQTTLRVPPAPAVRPAPTPRVPTQPTAATQPSATSPAAATQPVATQPVATQPVATQPVISATTQPVDPAAATQAATQPAEATQAATQPAAATQAATATQGPRVAVIDAAPIGVDPAAAQYVTNVLRQAVGELGFNVIPTPEMHEAARQIQLPFPVPVEGMVALEQRLQAPAAVTAEVRAASGLYVVRLRVRIDVEHQERVRRVAATQFQLADAVRAALPALLVPPSPDQPVSPEEPEQQPTSGTITPPNGLATPPGGGLAQPPRRRTYRAHPRRWEIGAGPIVAFGPGRDSFINFLGAARVGFFPIDRLGITATVAYANLNGHDERTHNVFFSLGAETAVDLVPSRHVFIPLRVEVGYLPKNGPVFRLTAGVAFQLARRVHLEVDLLSPTLWVLPETTPVSLDLGAFVRFGL